MLTAGEERGRHQGARSDVAKGQFHVGEKLEEQAEENRGDDKGQEKIHRVEQDRHAGSPAIEPRGERRERGADREGHEEKKADRDNEPEGSQTIEHKALDH